MLSTIVYKENGLSIVKKLIDLGFKVGVIGNISAEKQYDLENIILSKYQKKNLGDLDTVYIF